MPVKIFFCYAHEDEALLNKLKAHMKALKREGLIDIWHDRDISAGTEWEREISRHLNAAQIILLLVSPDFMDSDYCYGIEMKQAIERDERGEARVIPIILRPVDIEVTPFRKLQALPTDAKAVMSSSWQYQDEAFVNVIKGIREAINDLYKETKLDIYNRILTLSRRLSAILLTQNIPDWKAENQQLEDLIANDHQRLNISQSIQLLHDLIYRMTNALDKRKKEIDEQLDITNYIEVKNNLDEIVAVLDNAAMEIGPSSKQIGDMVKAFAGEFYRNFSDEVEKLVASYQIVQPVMRRELLFSRKDAIKRVVEELMVFLNNELDTTFRRWQSTTVQPFLLTKVKQEADQVNHLLSQLDMMLEDTLLPNIDFNFTAVFDDIHDDLTLYVDDHDLYVRESRILATLSDLANDPKLSDYDLSILRLVLMILAALLPFKNVPAKINEKIKSVVGQEYKEMISNSSPKRVDVIVRIVCEETKKQIDPIEEIVHRAHSVSTHALQAQEKRIITERKRLQMKVDKETQELTATSDELDEIKKELDMLRDQSLND